jgi:N-hydroxyarylamine O-acetyltransferase
VPDLDALLHRIGLDAAPEPTLDGLQTIHRAYVSAIPYEDLAVQLRAYRPLDVDELAERVLHGGRGGYCFELNSVLGWILEQVGFDVRRHQGVVGVRERLDPPAPVNHLALSVHLDEGVWLADAGLGEGQVDATPLVPGTYGDPLTMGVEAEAGGGWFLVHHPWGSFEGVRIAAPVVELDAFQPHHRRLATDPESKFVNTLVVQRPYRDRIETLRSRTFSVSGPHADDERRVLHDADDLATTLDERFGIDPGALGPAAIAELWERVEEQHERWLQTQAAQTR